LYQKGFGFIIEVIDFEDESSSCVYHNMRAAQAAGLDHLDVYATLCYNPDSEVSNVELSITEFLHRNFTGRIYLEIKDRADCWTQDLDKNAYYVQQLALNLRE